MSCYFEKACENCTWRLHKILTNHRFILKYRKSSGLKPFKCSHCEAAFASKFNLQKHVNAIHMKSGLKIWYYFNYWYKNYNLLDFWFKKVLISVEKPYKCENCKKDFSLKQNLKVHVDHVHLGRLFFNYYKIYFSFEF